MVRKTRLDQLLVEKGLADTRSQAENLIRLGEVAVDKKIVTKPGHFVGEDAKIKLLTKDKYVSRAALKLASVAKPFKLDFKNKTVLDVGSSTGGFTDFALQNGAKKAICVDVGTNQLHPKLRTDARIELHEQTDIRDVNELSSTPDMIVIDVSFISLKEILPQVKKLSAKNTEIVAMLKPQFEAGSSAKHKGVIKNEKMRRQVLQDFETWAKSHFVIKQKSDSQVAGTKGNVERFYLLKCL